MANAASIAREYTDAWNRRDWARYRQLLHPQYTYTGGDGKPQRGTEAGLAVAQMFATAFPDGRIEVKQLHAVNDRVAIVEFVGSGTHRGGLMGVPPTGRRVVVPVCAALEVRDGKILSERQYMDMHNLFQQIGVSPTPVTA